MKYTKLTGFAPQDIEKYQVIITYNTDETSSYRYTVIRVNGAYTKVTHCDDYEISEYEGIVRCYSFITNEVVEYMLVNSVLDITEAFI